MNRTTRWGAVVAASLLLAGCGSTAGDQEAGSPDSAPSAGFHVMPDGSVMSDEEMAGMGDSEPVSAQPSSAARMVCDGEIGANVEKLLGLDSEPKRNASWEEPTYTCTYSLDAGPLVLSVYDATAATAGRDHFETLRTTFDDTEDLTGMYGLGFPAFETNDGTVVFIKDNKTLEVDATELPDGLGPDGDLSQTEAAYAVAASVLACWKHD